MSPSPLAALAHASVMQLRETLRRVTSLHAPQPEEALEDEFHASLQAADAEPWEETCIDVRRCHG